MSYGRPAVTANFEMTTPPELLTRVAYNSSSGPNPFREDYLQWLLDSTPELLPVRDFFPTVLSVASLGREIPVDLGSKLGYIDNLCVTNDARLVIVETKLFRNPEGVREVIAQTYQYGEAVSRMSYLQFEAALRKGMQGASRLGPTETVADRMRREAGAGRLNGVVDDFEDRFATNMRRGEVLYLIVADGIHASVERMTCWLNEIAGSAPHRFGLIELRSYLTPDGGAVIVPRALLKTKEISRHVVVIETRSADALLSATVEDRTGTEAGALTITSRTVSPAVAPLTKDRLLQELLARPKAHEVAAALIGSLEAAAFDSRATATELQYGFTYPVEGGELLPMVSLSVTGVIPYLRTKVMTAVGGPAFADFKRRLHLIAPFYQQTEIDEPKKQWGHTQRYEDLDAKVDQIVSALVESRTVAIDALMRPVAA